MALIDLKTNLKSLRYGKDTIGGGSSKEPYITTSINSSPGDTGGPDFTLRANTLQRVGQDTERLSKFLFSSKGLQFTAKQNLLSRTAVKTQASGFINEGAYLPTSTLAQAAGNPFGTHLLKQGINPTRDTTPNSNGSNGIFDFITGLSTPLGAPVYTSVVTNTQPKPDNRLVQLKNDKIASPSQASPQGFLSGLFGDGLNNILDIFGNKSLSLGNKIKDVTSQLFSNTSGGSKYKNEILRYGGGPGSVLGVGQTVIKRYTDTSAYNTEEFRKKYYLLNGSLIAGGLLGISPEAKSETSKDAISIVDFRKPLLDQQSQGDKKNILSRSLPYDNPNARIEGRVNLGDPGKRNKNVSSYTKGLGEPLDKINALPLYKSTFPTTNPIKNDLVKFRIGVIQNNNPEEKVYIHFRAFIDSFDDNYSAEWNSEKFMGRGEKFYRYGGFDRNINISWTVAAQSKEELIPQYKKLNYLTSVLAPDYTPSGYMAGNLVTLTLGGWCYEQPGIITGMSLGVPQESPWEISIKDSGIGDFNDSDNTVKELPHIVKVTGFNFIPIHNFVPKIQSNQYMSAEEVGELDANNYGFERYIALSKGTTRGDNSYDSQEKIPSLTPQGVVLNYGQENFGLPTGELLTSTQGLSI